MAFCERDATVVDSPDMAELNSDDLVKKEETKQMVKIGKPAPMFKAPAYKDGIFTEVNLEDYKGKWTLLCFYPGDFTFV